MKMMANDIKLEEEINHHLSPYSVLYNYITLTLAASLLLSLTNLWARVL